MLPIIAVLAVSQLPPSPEPGPLDAFRANYASIKVDLHYEYKFGVARPEMHARLQHGEKPEFNLKADTGRWVLGRWGINPSEIDGDWSCDGDAVHYHFASPEWIFKQALERNGGLPNPLVNIFLETDAISDGSTFLGWPTVSFDEGWVPRKLRSLVIRDPKEPAYVPVGPFVWGLDDRLFPQFVEMQGADGEIERRTSQRDGHPVEMEIYKPDPTRSSGKLGRIEIAYDPALGHLPRHVRRLYRFDDGGAQIVEMYLVSARHCAAGGFVPTEQYNTQFNVPDFSKRYPRYDVDTVVEPVEDFNLWHFRVTDFKDRSAPVGLNLEHIEGVIMPGHIARFPADTRSMTMAQLKDFIHGHSGGPRASNLPDIGGGPTLDTEELKQFTDAPAPARNWPWYLGGGTLAVVGATFVLKRRIAARHLGLLVLGVWTAGCARQAGPPMARLSVDITPNHMLIERGTQPPPLKLVVRNTGDQPLQIRGADGGCSCRKIDPSKFPALLRSGASIALKVQLTTSIQASPRGFAITFNTDRGSVVAPASFMAFPSHQIDPNVFSASLQEGQDATWQFDLVHRTVYRADAPKPVTTLEAPAEFSVTKIGSRSGPVRLAPEFLFEDTTYRITLQDEGFGRRKEFLVLRDAQGSKLIEVPVGWERTRFLASAPSRVVLGARPVRVFLKCPDERVELTRVVSKPFGVKAVVSSLRELTVMLEDGAPDVINGLVEVGTTAPDRPSLKIPIVRYGPTRHAAAR